MDAREMPGGFRADPAKPGTLFILAPRQPQRRALAIETLPPHAAGIALLGHFYGASWLCQPRSAALEWCAVLAAQAQVRMVSAPNGLEHVRDTALAMLRECGQPGA